MKCIFIVFAVLITNVSAAQTSKAELLSAVNADIWIPFLKGVNENIPDLYNSMLSTDFYWVLSGSKTRIMNRKEYVDDAIKVMDQRKQKGISTELQVRFLERNVNNEFCSEKCVIRFISKEEAREIDQYGAVQIFSRKENGRWLKVVQYVYTDPVSKEVFEKADPMDKF